MTSSPTERSSPLAERVEVSNTALTVQLTDGRVISVPLDWFPRLASANIEERNHWRLIGRGEGINWPDLDEDISVEGLLSGIRSQEGVQSFNSWNKSRP